MSYNGDLRPESVINTINVNKLLIKYRMDFLSIIHCIPGVLGLLARVARGVSGEVLGYWPVWPGRPREVWPGVRGSQRGPGRSGQVSREVSQEGPRRVPGVHVSRVPGGTQEGPRAPGKQCQEGPRGTQYPTTPGTHLPLPVPVPHPTTPGYPPTRTLATGLGRHR